MDNEVLVETGNMEQLAALVLNGEGERLVGMSSDNPELQTFLENVPTYMSKIHRIHEASRSGSLRDLQAALDRRKFAIAKDSISPKGASPLHVAVVFGNTSIVRYLAGRFPETLQMVDDDGRTPLHYAAVLNDNGHYYNLLVHLGADMRVDDNLGFSPEYYRKNQQDFNHRSLLRDFGAEEDEAEEILADKVPNDVYSARKNLDDEDMLAVLERCYNVLQSRRGSTVSNASASTISSTSQSGFFLSKHVRRHVFDTVKLRLTKQDNNLYDIIWPSVKKLPIEPSFRVALEQDFPMGISAPDFYCYHVFKEFLDPIIKDYNHLNIYNDLPDQPQSTFCEKDENANTDFDRDLDPQAKYILSGTLEASRNIDGFELPKSLNTGQLELVERIITTVLMSKEVAKALYPLTPEREIEEKGCGTYYTMNEVLEDTSEAKVVLASNGLLIPLWNIPDSDRLHGKHWPYGRGVFVSNGANLAVWVNVLDHIRIITCTDHSHPANVGQVFSRVSRLVGVLHQHLNFVFDEKLGFLSARPSAIGNTLQFNLTLRFPHLIKEPDNLRHLCTVRSLTYHRNTSTTDVVRIGNQQCLGVTETQGFEDFTMAVANILQLEKDLAMTNSMHIAATFLNIFKKKKLAESA
uniref:Arginine kinase-like isoform X2 n=1 Tax=Diabrotica virgifera virgifera TaxID=50390 RepID=A0A6P7GN83_DIAVI